MKLEQSTEEDLPFIFNSWLKDYRKNVRLPAGIYFSGHHRIIERLLEKSICLTLKEEGVIVAWIVYEPDCLHYLYVKHLYHGFNIEERMLLTTFPKGCECISHNSRTLAALLPLATFNPYRSIV